MPSTDQIQVVFLQKFGNHVGAESERHSAVVLVPAQLGGGVGPQQVAQQPCKYSLGVAQYDRKFTRVGDVARPRNRPDLAYVQQVGADSAMAAEDFVVDYRRDR